MPITQYHPEVQAQLDGFLEYRQIGGKWAVWLNPEMLAGFKEEPLPPGQGVRVSYHPAGYEVFYTGELELERLSAERFSQYRDLALWAVHPHFHSAESAQRMALQWLNETRTDIVNACIGEVSEAMAWRAKNRRPAE